MKKITILIIAPLIVCAIYLFYINSGIHCIKSIAPLHKLFLHIAQETKVEKGSIVLKIKDFKNGPSFSFLLNQDGLSRRLASNETIILNRGFERADFFIRDYSIKIKKAKEVDDKTYIIEERSSGSASYNGKIYIRSAQFRILENSLEELAEFPLGWTLLGIGMLMAGACYCYLIFRKKWS